MTAAHVVVAIPTYRRPEQLARLLVAIAALEDAPLLTVIVADNDGDGQQGIARARALRDAGYGPPVEAFAVPGKGLSNVRNALIARALAVPAMSHVAMIDDDEWPEPGWLAALLRQQRASDADVVAGPVHARFDCAKPGWADETLIFRPELRPAGSTGMLWGANNLLVTRACLEATARPWFDPAYDLTGGEDVDLFTRWHRAGRAFAWAPEAGVNESVPPDRARLGWVMRRMWRMGGTDIRVARKARPGFGSGALLAARSGAILAARTAALPLALWPAGRRVDHLGEWVKSWGRIAALLGYGYREYR